MTLKLICIRGITEMQWSELAFWSSEHWTSVQVRLDTMDKDGISYNPKRAHLFAAMDEVPFDDVTVVIVGQDPYPTTKHATGIAFHTGTADIPPTLANIYQEYVKDLHYPLVTTGDLTKWTSQGVFLWNAIPTCETGKSLSHKDWYEWEHLTREIVQKLSEKKLVTFVFLGGVARQYVEFVDQENNDVIETSHPSPRASAKSYQPFFGSRIFTRINGSLVSMNRPTIDWRL